MKTKLAFVCALLFATIALAAPSDKDQIRARSEQRFPQIKQFKTEGKIGETSDGLIEAVKGGGDAAMDKLIADENSDRQALYKIIAQEQGIDPAEVAKHAAARNYDHLHKGEYFKDHGSWRQK